MKLSDAYPSNYLKADDLQGKSVIVRIESVTLEELGQGMKKERKLVIGFIGKSKAMVCNKTNAGTIAKLYGDDTDGWINQPITIKPMEVEFGGEMVLAIRVSLQKPVTAQPGPASAHGMLGKPAVRPAPVEPVQEELPPDHPGHEPEDPNFEVPF